MAEGDFCAGRDRQLAAGSKNSLMHGPGTFLSKIASMSNAWHRGTSFIGWMLTKAGGKIVISLVFFAPFGITAAVALPNHLWHMPGTTTTTAPSTGHVAAPPRREFANLRALLSRIVRDYHGDFESSAGPEGGPELIPESHDSAWIAPFLGRSGEFAGLDYHGEHPYGSPPGLHGGPPNGDQGAPLGNADYSGSNFFADSGGGGGGGGGGSSSQQGQQYPSGSGSGVGLGSGSGGGTTGHSGPSASTPTPIPAGLWLLGPGFFAAIALRKKFSK